MNIDQIRLTIARIADNPSDFNMGCYSACIIGFSTGHIGDEFQAQTVLGLTDQQADELFFPDVESYLLVTPEMAISTLQHLITTGQVDWNPPTDLAGAPPEAL